MFVYRMNFIHSKTHFDPTCGDKKDFEKQGVKRGAVAGSIAIADP